MKANQIDTTTVNTVSECHELIGKIEGDYRNYVGGYSRWTSGLDCHLTSSAKTMIKRLQNKADKLFVAQFEIDIEKNSDRYSEFKFKWTVYIGHTVISEGLALTKAEAKKEANEVINNYC